jgi:hypothetical protein
MASVPVTATTVGTSNLTPSQSWQLIQAINPDTNPAQLSTQAVYVNGSTIGASGVYQLSTMTFQSPLFINGQSSTTTNSVPAYLAELLVFSTPLTTIQRTQVENYLSAKWNLPNQIPSWTTLTGTNPDPAAQGYQSFYKNGSTLSTAAIQTATTLISSPLFINGQASTTNGSIPAYLAELVVFSTTLTTVQRQAIEGYLANKWATRPFLPPTHAYAAARPTTAPLGIDVSAVSSVQVLNLFDPTKIPACSIWFDASDPYGTYVVPPQGTTISTLKNKGTVAGLQAQAGSAAAPTLSTIGGYKILAFNGFQALSTTAFTLSNTQGTTWFAAYATQANLSTAATAAVFGTTGFPERAIRQSNTSQFVGHSIHTGTTRTATNAGTLNTLSFYTILDTPTAFTAFKNGSVLTSTTTNVIYMSGNSQTARIGIWDTTFSGSIAELIAYDAPLTTIQRQQIEGYLAWKWGLQTQLPTTHPFISSTTLATGRFPQVPIIRGFALVPVTSPITSITLSGSLSVLTVSFTSVSNNPSYIVALYSNTTNSTTDGTLLFTAGVTSLTATFSGSFSYSAYYYATIKASIFGGPTSVVTSAAAYVIPTTRTQLTTIASYSLTAIAASVPASSATPTTIASFTLPTVSATDAGALSLFFNLYSAATFAAGQNFTYGLYLNGTALSIADTTQVRYTQTASGTYAMESAGVLLGTGGISSLAPLQLFFTLPSGTNTLTVAIANSSAAMPTSVQVGVAATLLYTVPNT